MNDRGKWTIIAAVAIVALGATTAVGITAWAQYDTRTGAPSEAVTSSRDWTDGDRIVFRNTADGQGYGHVASVALTDPGGARAISDVVCDRVDATPSTFACLRTVRGIAPSYTAAIYGNDGTVQQEWPLPGIPSRTRISDDGSLVATTAFVTGHSYATIGFSTETVIRVPGGGSLGSLEDWTLVIDGEPAAPVDRNFWGVTFVDDTSFYATVGISTQGSTHLVSGDLTTRTLTTVAENVECPSISPDRTRLAFKRLTAGAGPTAHWTPAVFDIATGAITLLPESRSIDDQIEWLDDDTVLYGMPREGAAGTSDVWSLAADGSSAPQMFLEQAWSPAVVRAP